MEETIKKFYESFSNLDSEKMISFYHDDIVFEDPAFGVLKGEKAKNMWKMLCEASDKKTFKVTFSNIKTDKNEGTAKWEAWYNFSKTGRKVHNVIYTQFEFKDGKIIKHTDTFNLHKWASQALGVSGFLLGKTKLFKKKLNSQANKALSIFESKMNR